MPQILSVTKKKKFDCKIYFLKRFVDQSNNNKMPQILYILNKFDCKIKGHNKHGNLPSTNDW